MAQIPRTKKPRSTRHDVLTRALSLISRAKYLDAGVLLHNLLRTESNDPELLYPLATCQRNMGQYNLTLSTLDRLEKARPNFAGTCLERARVFEKLERIQDAISSYEDCTRLNPAYLGGWIGILELRSQVKDPQLVDFAKSQYTYFANLDRAFLLIQRAYYDGETYKAERLCREYLKKKPKDVEAMRLLARIGIQYGILDDAEFILESACEFEPQNSRVRLEYIDVLHKRQQFGKALEQSKLILEQRPNSLLSKLAYANQQVAVGTYKPAIDVYNEILTEHSDSALANPQLYLTRGHVHKTNGNIDQSIADYRSAYRKRKDFGDAYWSLANLKTYRFTQDELNHMHNLAVSSNTSVEDRIHFLFALGKSYEDLKDFESSYRFYEDGNRLNLERLRYDAEEMTLRLELQEQVCTRDFLHARKGQGCNATDPIFIVGLPRAGSTLLEQILASHSQVEGTLELHHISAYAQKLDGRRRRNEPPRYPHTLRELGPDLLRELGERFIRETRIHRTQAPYFIDKMPNNFRHVGLISMILPHAKFIDARRHPMSCCFSCYKQLFASGQEFTYGQLEIAAYYRDYCRLMDHWDRVMPGKVLRVYYEDVVSDLEDQVRRILDYCGLPFEESCLRYYETERSIRTPSAEQVRQPIYRDGLDQWRNYETWLEPMKDALGNCMTKYPDSF